MPQYVTINSDLIEWAIERSGKELRAIAGSTGAKPEKIRSWISGDLSPTLRQAQKLAKAVHVPFGYLIPIGTTKGRTSNSRL